MVYEAFDREQGGRVALKVLDVRGAEALLRFKNEYRVMHDLRHPNLVALDALIEHEGTWFFTMELVDGVDFLTWVGLPELAMLAPTTVNLRDQKDSDLFRPALPLRSAPPTLDDHRLRAALAQLACGLEVIHASGKVHRDIKPSNVLVTPTGRVVILDFGLVLDVERSDRVTDVDEIVGTTEYMAPEQAGSAAISAAADWYSVGVILFQALTGHLPFSGARFDVLVDKRSRDAAPVGVLAPGAPRDLEALCRQLLHRDPGVRPRAEGVLAQLGVARSVAPAAVHAGSSSTFVGRQGELAALRTAFDDVRRGSGVTLFVQGESGIGKSALVRHFLDDLESADSSIVILSGRCYEQEQLPYKAFDGIVDALSWYLSHIDSVVAARLLPDDAALLARVFPVLRRVPAMSGVEEPRNKVHNPQELRTRAFAALRQILSRLAKRRPLVLFVDDFQWAEADSLALLVDVMHPPDPPPLFLMATLRDTTLTMVPEGLADVRHLRLPRLAPDEARELVSLLWPAACGNAATAEEITAESAGHPLFIQELVRHALARGEQTTGPLRLDEALRTRIARLDPETRTILEVVTIAGAPLPQRIVAEAIGLPSPSFTRRLAQLQDEHLVRDGGARASDSIEPYHDRVREAVVGHLSAEVRAEHHARLAAAWERAGASARDPLALVRHLAGAGQRDRAAHQARRAAQIADEALAFEQAAELYRIALRLGSYDEAEYCRLQIRLGDTLANAGRSAEAAELYLSAARGVDPGTRLECQRRAAEQFLISGHIERGLAALEAVLAQLGVSLHATPARALLSMLWQRLRLRLRGVRWKPKYATELPQRELTRLDVYRTVSLGLGMVDTIRGADFQARGLLLALRTGERRHVGRSLAFEATYLASQGRKSLARAYRLLEQAERIAKESSDPHLIAWVSAAGGVLRYFEGKFSAAETRLALAERLLLSTAGTTRDVNTLRIFRLFALRAIGAARELRRWLDDYVRDASRRGDRYAETTLSRSSNVVWLMEGSPDRARDDLERTSWTPPHGGFHLQHWYELRARCEIALYEGRLGETLSRAELGFAALKRSLLTRVQTVRAETHWLRARLTIAMDGPGDAGRIRAVARAARRLDRERMPFISVWSLLLQAALACRAGQSDRAETLLGDTVDLAAEHDMPLCAAVARRRRGELVGGDAGVRLVAQGDESMRALGIHDPTRMVELIAPGFTHRV